MELSPRSLMRLEGHHQAEVGCHCRRSHRRLTPLQNRLRALAAEQDRRRSQFLKMESTEVRRKTNHGVMFYHPAEGSSKGYFSITPLDCILQMRPCVGDMLSQQRRFDRDFIVNDGDDAGTAIDVDYSTSEAKNGEEEETLSLPVYPVHHRKESERGYQKRVQRYAHRQQVEHSEQQESLRVVTLRSEAPDAKAVRDKIAGKR